jgi:hypothetical protein
MSGMAEDEDLMEAENEKGYEGGEGCEGEEDNDQEMEPDNGVSYLSM